MKVDAATVPRDPADTGGETLLVSNAGGLTQFGAYSVTLPPSAKATASHRHRHWHSVEDEFLLVLDGTATVIDDNGAHQLGADDAAARRKGDPNAHHVLNQSAAQVRYLVIGSRVAEGILQSDLDEVSTAVLADDWNTCRDAVCLPSHINSQDESKVVATLDDLKAGCDLFRETLRARRVTDYFRRIESAALLEPALISGKYVSPLLAGG